MSGAKGRARERRKRRKGEDGVAIIMVVGAVTVLSVMLAEMQDDASAEYAAATADRDALQAEYLARSAINLSRLLVAAEPTLRTAIAPLFMLMKQKPPQLPVWEYADRILGAFNDKESASDFAGLTGVDLSLGKNLGLKGGRFEVRIVDEDAKINVNSGGANEMSHRYLGMQLMGVMAPPQYNPLFEQRDSDGQFHDRLTICAAVLDWTDPDEKLYSCDFTATAAGASQGVEDAYYQLLKVPYRRKNAPFDSLEELHMVRGFNDDFWATFVDPDATRPDKRVVTVWGQGKVNVNTANAQTLLGVVCSGSPDADICNDPVQSQTFLTGVTMARGMTMGAPLFGATDDFVQMMNGKGQFGEALTKMLGMKPVKFKSASDFNKTIATESKVFSLYAVGIVSGYKRETRTQVTAVVDFRKAPPLPTATATATTTGGAAPPPAPTGSATSATDALTAALKPSAGGSVLYYKVQ